MIEVKRDTTGVFLVEGQMKGCQRKHLLSTYNGDSTLIMYRQALAKIKARPRGERHRTVEEIVKELREA